MNDGPLEQGAEVVPGYTVTDHLRRGEDYDTYTAWSTARYSHCVVKTPRPDRARRASVRRSLVREGRLLLAASHPHLVRAYELHAPRAGAPALVLEALGGPSLAYILAEQPRLPAPSLPRCRSWSTQNVSSSLRSRKAIHHYQTAWPTSRASWPAMGSPQRTN